MNPALLSSDAYALIRGLRHIRQMKVKFTLPKIREELMGHGLVVSDDEWITITERGMAIPRLVRPAPAGGPVPPRQGVPAGL